MVVIVIRKIWTLSTAAACVTLSDDSWILTKRYQNVNLSLFGQFSIFVVCKCLVFLLVPNQVQLLYSMVTILYMLTSSLIQMFLYLFYPYIYSVLLPNNSFLCFEFLQKKSRFFVLQVLPTILSIVSNALYKDFVDDISFRLVHFNSRNTNVVLRWLCYNFYVPVYFLHACIVFLYFSLLQN